MKQLLITIAAVMLVGCGPSMSIHEAAKSGYIEIVKEHFIRTKYDLGLNKCLDRIDNLIN